MRIGVRPPVSEHELLAIRAALEAAGTTRGASRVCPARSAWSAAAAQEAVEGEPRAAGYAPSPRSTRGATRA